MTGEERRKELLEVLRRGERPVPGGELARQFAVSRQIIVQDIALLRAAGYDILSMNKGYCIRETKKVKRIFKVSHTDEELEEELNAIVDLGGCVSDVFIHHKVYGQIRAALQIDSRRRVKEFLAEIKSGKSSPLKNITSNYHYHTVEADSEETLNLIEEELLKRGFLIENEER